jgi:hypothetical protein
MPSVESSLTLVSTVRSEARFAPVWSWGPPNRACSMPSWTTVANASGSEPADASAPTPRLDWRACAPSSAERRSGKPYARPSTVWPSSPRRGSTRIAKWRGSSAMDGAWRITADRRGETTVTPRRTLWEPMAMPYGPIFVPPQRRHGGARCLPSRRDAGWGSSHAIWRPGACIGGRNKQVFHRRGC